MPTTEHPVLFNSEMVRAILDNLKTHTRRVPVERYRNWKVGDRLWVRETWRAMLKNCPANKGGFRAFDLHPSIETSIIEYKTDNPKGCAWKSLYHMPKWACRIWLEITGLRVEGVQEITEEDARAEGCDCSWLIHQAHDDAHNKRRAEIYQKYGIPVVDTKVANEQSEFAYLWNSINAKRHNGIYAWDKNPYCKCISFKRIDKP